MSADFSARNYVTIESGRRLVPTSLGIVLVHGYLKIDPDLVKPTMRSAVEKQLDLIAHGKADFQSVLKHTLEVFKLKFLYFVKNIEGMDQLFEVSFSSLADSGRPFSRCVISEKNSDPDPASTFRVPDPGKVLDTDPTPICLRK